MATLFGEEHESEKQTKLTIDSSFAEKYEAKKRREELGDLRDKYGDAPEDEESSSSEEEDEVGEGMIYMLPWVIAMPDLRLNRGHAWNGRGFFAHAVVDQRGRPSDL